MKEKKERKKISAGAAHCAYTPRKKRFLCIG